MGVSKSADDLARKLSTFGTKGIPAAEQASVAQAAQVAQARFAAALVTNKAVVWRNMRGTGRARATVGKKSAVVGVYGAPAYVRERGAPPHIIAPRFGPKGKVGKRGPSQAQAAVLFGFIAGGGGTGGNGGAVLTPAGPRRYVKHPGIKATPYFEKTAVVIAAETPKVAQAELHKELAKQFA